MTSLQQERILELLKRYPGLDIEEISVRMEKPMGSIKTQLYRLRKEHFVYRNSDGWWISDNIGVSHDLPCVDTSIIEILKEEFEVRDSLLSSDEDGVVDVDWPCDTFDGEEVLLAQPLDMIGHFQDVYREKFFVDSSPFFSFHGVPVMSLGEVGTDHIGHMISVEGDIVGHEQPRPTPIRVRVRCPKCGVVEQSKIDKGSGKPTITECGGEECKGIKVSVVPDSFTFRDEQWFMVEEIGAYDQANKTTMNVLLPPELIKHADPSLRVVRDGNTVRVCGVLRTVTRKEKNEYITSTYIDASSVELLQSDILSLDISVEEEEDLLEFSRRSDVGDALVSCVAPDVYGMELAKKTLLLSSVYVPMGDKRNNVNVLLVGHTGIAKTQLVLWWVKHYPRSSYSSGVGASSVGLFGMAQRQEKKDGGRYTILSGTIPRADGGIAVVDEMEKQVAKWGEGWFLEAMEKRTVTIQKGDARASLPADCPIWCLCNWRNMLPPDENNPRVASLPREIGNALRNRCIILDMDVISRGVDMDRVSWTMLARFGDVPVGEGFSPPLGAEALMKYLSLAKRLRPKIPLDVAKIIHGIVGSWRVKKSQGSVWNMQDHVFDLTARLQDDFAIMVVSSAMLHMRSVVSVDDVYFVLPVFQHMVEEWAKVDGKIDASLLSVGLSSVELGGRSEVLATLRGLGGMDVEALAHHVPMVLEEPRLLARLVEERAVVEHDGMYRLPGGGE